MIIKKGLSLFESVVSEVLILFVFLFISNQYIGIPETTINADGVGYYDYLPSTFIHHDLVRYNEPFSLNKDSYQRILPTGVYVPFSDFHVNKYPCGTAVLQLPFFFYAHYTTKLDNSPTDGYQKPFQKTVGYAAIFYLFLSLLFLKKVLVLYDIKPLIVFFCQFTLVLATPITIYASNDAGFSHVYSLFAITAFVFFTKSYFIDFKRRNLIWASLLLGLIFILRQPNLLIVLFVPFLAGSWNNLKIGISTLLRNKKNLLFALAAFLLIASIQFTLWYLQTGRFIIDSYQAESFDFTDPHLIDILFSYRKGLFVYTPILFFGIFGLVGLVFKKDYFLVFSWLFFFFILTYILSSWWSWYFGSSFGLRAYIDYFVIFFIPIALLLDSFGPVVKVFVLLISLLTIQVNCIQSYQYNQYILHYHQMDKEKYWKVFLKTEDVYKGLLWKEKINQDDYNVIYTRELGTLIAQRLTATKWSYIKSTEIPNFELVTSLKVSINNRYEEQNRTRVVIGINRAVDDSIYYWQDRALLHFHEKQFDQWQTGYYNFEFNPMIDKEAMIITFETIGSQAQDTLKNVRLEFLQKLPSKKD